MPVACDTQHAPLKHEVVDDLDAQRTFCGQQGALLSPRCSSRAQAACAHDSARALGCGVASPSHSRLQDGWAPPGLPGAASATGV